MLLANYQRYANFQQEITNRLIEKLDFVKFEPRKILNLGAATGYSTQKLSARFPKAQISAVDHSVELLRQTPRRWPWWRAPKRVCAQYINLPFSGHSVDMIFANIFVLWPFDIKDILREFYQILKPNGMILFATLGVDTLMELRQSFTAVDHYVHVFEFLDMHDIGDLLTTLQFTDPVMDMEKLVINYPSIPHLINDLRAFRACHSFKNKRNALMGKNRWQKMLNMYSQYTIPHNNKYPVTIEMIYGHAWLPQQKSSQSASLGEVTIPINSIKKKTQKF